MTKTRFKRLGVIILFAVVVSISYTYLTNQSLPWYFATLFGFLAYWLSTAIFPNNEESQQKEQ